MMVKHTKSKDIEKRVIQNGAMEKKQAYLKKRKFDDDWYFRRFGVEF
jgi:hypothetical protein